MRLIKLELNGFKSFARKTELIFGDGITAVIGPNGSGKSNIADAVRWVLGEQSAKALRGTRMEDVIFSGTQQKKAQSFCEVTLTFDNSDAKLAVPFTEVAVTRRVYRSGESEYCINKSPCRLRDVLDMFRDTGIGKDGYSIIGQGKVEEILSNKSNERRAALEEAAGVMRYRVRKEEAERKLDHTEKNLERIEDIIAELGNRLRPLEEQSKAARAFLKLRDELRDLEVNLFLYQYERSKERLSVLNETIEQLTAEEAHAQTISETLLNQTGEIESQLKGMDASLIEQQNRLMTLLAGVENQAGECNLLLERREHFQSEIARLQSERERFLARAKELSDTLAGKTSYEANQAVLEQLERDIAFSEKALRSQDESLAGAEADLERMKNQIMDAMNRLADAKSGLSRFDAMETAINERICAVRLQRSSENDGMKRLETELSEAKSSLRSVQSEHLSFTTKLHEAQTNRGILEKKFADAAAEQRGLEQELSSLRSRLHVIREMAKSRDGYYASIKSIMADAEHDKELSSSIIGVVAELIHVPKEYELAITMALGSSLQNIVTPTANDAKYVIEYLRKKNYGRATLLPIALLRGNPLGQKDLSYLQTEGCFGLASALVDCDAQNRSVVEYLLGRTVVVRDLATGIALKKRSGGAFHIATLEGDIIHIGGSMSGGSRQKQGFSLLGRDREIRELQETVLQREEKLTELYSCCRSMEQELLLAGVQEDSFRSALHEKELELARQSEKVDIIARDIEKNKEQVAFCERELQQLDDNLADVRQQKTAAAHLQQDIEAGNAASREDVLAAQAVIAQRRLTKEKETQDITEKKLRLLSLQKEKDAAHAEAARLTAERDASLKSSAAHEHLILEASAQLQQTEAKLGELQKNVQQDQSYVDEQKLSHHALEEERAAKTEFLSQLRKQREDTLMSLREYGERKHRSELQRNRIEVEMTALQDRIWNDYELTYDNAVPLRREIVIGASGTRVGEIKNAIREMGDINLSSIEDYRAVSERYNALSTQYADLRKAKSDLESLIAELIDTMKKEFERQFTAIQRNFGQTFIELFGGGQAELRLSDKNDVLGCDIDIIAQPPGKKLQLLSLLSGGERALTAIALLFAMLQLKPPAFCLLDEIESSLDEVNVSRFAEYVRSYSDETQFVLITHRKGSMEVCNSLYGVSMEERGVSKVVSARFGEAG